jgi:hypothetical protein
MRRENVLLTAAVAAAAGISALVVVAVVSWDRIQETRAARPQVSDSHGIEASAALRPRIALFGDTVRAQVDAVVDTKRVDPESVRVAVDFTPWRIVGKPERSVREAGDTAYVRTTFVLRCLTGACVISGRSARLEFPPARISFVAPSGQPADRSAIRLPLPRLLVYPRFDPAAVVNEGGSAVPWRADLLSLPAVTYRVPPSLLVALLLSGAVLAVIAAGGLAYVAWPRRVPPPPEPEPEPVVVRVLSPLEQALALLEETVRVDGAEGQRRALELVAEELELTEWGDRELARAARVLAWSEEVPPIEETSELAARVRSTLPAVEEDAENGDGHVV